MMKSWRCLSVCYLLKVIFFLLGQIAVVECQFGHGNNFVIFFMLPRNKKDSLTMGQNLLQALFLTSGRHQTSMSLFIAPGPCAWVGTLPFREKASKNHSREPLYWVDWLTSKDMSNTMKDLWVNTYLLTHIHLFGELTLLCLIMYHILFGR